MFFTSGKKQNKRFFEPRIRIEKQSKLSDNRERRKTTLKPRGKRNGKQEHEEIKNTKKVRKFVEQEKLGRRVPGGSSENAAGLLNQVRRVRYV